MKSLQLKTIGIFKKTVVRSVRMSVLLFVVCSQVLPSGVVALSPLQQKVLKSGILYFDADPPSNDSCPGNTTNNSGPASGDTYIVGDSISQGLHLSNFEQELSQATGGSTHINYDSGRSISSPGTDQKTSGIQAIEADKNKIVTASNLIIILGTNPENSFEQNLKSMVSKLKGYNSSAKIYWVDIGATKSGDEPGGANTITWSGYNQIIYNNATSLGYTVISRYKALFGHDKDPLNIAPGVQIPGSSDYIHGGYQQLGDEIKRVFEQGTGGDQGTPSENLGARDKAAQLLFVRVNSEQEARDAADKYKVGGIYISDWKDQAVLKDISEKSSTKIFIGIDEEGGKVHRLSDRGAMPSAKEMGGLPNNEVTAVASQWGAIMQEYSVNVDFAPVVDLAMNGSFINNDGRAFSENPNTVSEKAGAFAEGLRSKQITPVFKHFPGHGRVTNDSHQGPAPIPYPLSNIKQSDLVPYKTLLQNPNSMVMLGHLGVEEWNRAVPTSINSKAYELLRGEYGFKGVAMTDDLEMGALGDAAQTPKHAEDAVRAGADIALFSSIRYVEPILDSFESLYNKNGSFKKRVDESYDRIMNLKGLSKNSTATTGRCACIALNGAENKAKIWNYLAGKNLTPQQIAGIMGNIQSESGGTWDPRIVEYGYRNSRGEVSKAGQPSSLDENVPPDDNSKGQPGYGLVQWTAGRKWNLKSFAETKGLPAGSLGLQLDFLWEELNTSYKSNTLEPILASTTIEDSTNIFLTNFERPADIPGTRPTRENNARALFTEFGSVAPSGGGGSC